MIAVPPEAPLVAPPEPTRTMPQAPLDAVATPAEATARRGPSRWNETTLMRLAKLVVELE